MITVLNSHLQKLDSLFTNKHKIFFSSQNQIVLILLLLVFFQQKLSYSERKQNQNFQAVRIAANDFEFIDEFIEVYYVYVYITIADPRERERLCV